MDFFTSNGKRKPIGRKIGIMEKDLGKESKDFIKVPDDHTFNSAYRNAERRAKKLTKK